MTFGSTTVRYDQVLTLQKSGSVLLARDGDKQDDMAALRTFSSHFLSEVVAKCFDNASYRGVACYLFVLGDLCDSYLNRTIGHKQRILMVMRGWFFLNAWRTYVCNVYGDNKHKHFISDQSFEILTSMCLSLLMLVKGFREYCPQYPLLPWMYGSEACEHVFGDARKIMSDFTLLDFYHIIPKIKYMQLTAYERKLKPPAKFSKSAAGYDIEITRNADVDTAVLCTWPTDEDISEVLHIAHTEAIALLKLGELGCFIYLYSKQYFHNSGRRR